MHTTQTTPDTGAAARTAKAIMGRLDPEFAEKLHQVGGCTIGYFDVLRTIGEFVVVKDDGYVDENHPKTKIAKDMIDFLKSSARGFHEILQKSRTRA